MDHFLFSHKIFKWTVITLASLIILIGAFALGVKVGYHEASFALDWQRDYPKNFVDYTGAPVAPGTPGPEFRSHGLVGVVLNVDNGELILKDNGDSTEKKILVGDDTTIRQNNSSLKLSDLKASSTIVVIGEPDDQGQIEARFIRVLGPQMPPN